MYKRTSPLFAQTAGRAQSPTERLGMAVAEVIASAEAESAAVSTLALADVSHGRKCSIKGPGAARWAASLGVAVPEAVNGAAAFGLGGWVVRLGVNEVFVDDPQGERADRIAAAGVNPTPGVHVYARHDTSMLLAGARAHEVLAQTCAYNFRRHEGGAVQTRVAGVSAVLVPVPDDAPAWRLWCSNSYGPYLWEQLSAIAGELGGAAVGLAALTS